MEEAAGSAVDFDLLCKIMELFPQACPSYLRGICLGKQFSNESLNEIIEEMLTAPSYPKRQQQAPSPERELGPEDQKLLVKSILPDVDPEFLDALTNEYFKKTGRLRTYITQLLASQNYPRKQNRSRRNNQQRIRAQQHQYTDKFNIDDFLKLFPDPETYFNDPERKSSIVDITKDPPSYQYAMNFLKNMYNYLPARTITLEFRANNYSVIKTANALEKLAKRSKANSSGAVGRVIHYYKKIENIPLLQEIAYIKHRNEIKSLIKQKRHELKIKRNRARRSGLMKTCQCCFDDELLPDEVVKCEKNCLFCKNCLKMNVEIGFAEGKTSFTCLDNCNSDFTLEAIQKAVAPKLFSKLLQKKQHEEVQAAGIEGLAVCPFCDFAIIIDPNYYILQCLNPECMKETCRLCKELSHIPLRCDEVEEDDNTKARIYLESKMTEALLRKCHNCGLKFIKSDGCNNITCSCGAKMCYICKNPVEDYTHFNGPGGTEFEKCPLFNDTHQLHENNVMKEAIKAKAELTKRFKKSNLLHDPSADIEKHYRELRQENPENLPAGIIPQNIPDRNLN